MRCPKCGYISFDHLDQCLKCKKNIKAVSDTLHGTVFHVEIPTFLRLSRNPNEEQEADEVFADPFEADEEFVDEDLEVLVKAESASEIAEVVMVDDLDVEDQRKSETALGESINLEDREIEIDLSQFEDAEEPERAPVEAFKVQNDEESASLVLNLPAELADLSDLAPPSGLEVQLDKAESKKVATKRDVTNLEMSDVDFDLGLGDLDADLGAGLDKSEETMLALDDIDFTETLKSSENPSGKKSGSVMDEDLNFDLDLGGLSIHKDL